MSETHYCHYHPNTPTSLRCNKCGKYICIKDARRTPVGYRCKECVREQQNTFFTATPVDYVITGVIALPLAFIAAQIVPRLGFLTIFAGPVVGMIISEAVHRATGKRRGRYLPHTVAAAVVIGGVIPTLLTLLLSVLATGLSGDASFLSSSLLSFSLIWRGLYVVLAAGSAYYQVR